MLDRQLAHYRITAPLGAGGMGEVWRADDQKLGRQVAIKLLPESMAQDPERLARFEREARALAQLNHPNIAAIYGLEEADGVRFLVLELVEGETLAERIERGPVPVAEALQTARQIAEGMAEAHAAGILHRDLKPANVKVTPDGKVKVLDFGLAKPFLPAAASTDANLSLSPTLTFGGATQAGVLLGTAAYMSPEQARGQAVDRRADIWAFGCVLFEMLAGRRLFQGSTISDTLASILKEEPPWDALPEDLPRSARRLLRRTLAKDPEARLHDIADARLEIDEALVEPAASTGGASQPGTPAAARRGRFAVLLPWAVALLALVVVIALATRTPSTSAVVVRSSLPPPVDADYYLLSRQPGPAALSPDGTMLVFAARDADRVIRLWLRRLDAETATPLAGTEGGSYPFWSPDSRTIGFFADSKLKRIDAAGGPALTLAPAPFGKGGSWSPDGTILFAPNYNSGLQAVPVNGGEVRDVTTVNADRRENSHRFPWLLPDGKRFLFLMRISGGEENEIAVGTLGGGEPRTLLRSPTQPEYASGHLLFLRERVLMAQPFDPVTATLSAEPFVAAEQVHVIPGAARAVFSASTGGMLVYGREGASTYKQLGWVNLKGETLRTLGDPLDFGSLRISPDGRKVAVTVDDLESGRSDIWVLDAESGGRQRITFGAESSLDPVWYPDGKRLVFRTRSSGQLDLYEKASDGSGEARLLLQSEYDKLPSDLSPDGRFLLFSGASGEGLDIQVLPLDDSGEVRTLVATPAFEEAARFSPDGRWVAYSGLETGRPEIYVTSFPDAGSRFQVSRDGGEGPRWSRDGKFLYFLAPDDTLMRAAVSEGVAGLVTAPPEPLFGAPMPTYGNYDIFEGRAVLEVESEQRDRRPLTLLQNWPALGKR